LSRAPRVLVAGAVLGQAMGGVRRHNMELLPRVARLLIERGGALGVLEGRTPIAFELPAEIERLSSRVPAAPPLQRAAAEGRALQAALDAAHARGRAFDLVHTAHLPVPRLRSPWTLTLHDLRHVSEGNLLRRVAATSMVRSAVRAATRVFVVSESVASELVQRFELPRERIGRVPNAADHFDVLPRDVHANAELLCVGHLEPRKNLELVLQALARDASLPGVCFAGASKGDEEMRLRALCGRLGLLERVRFLGPFDDARLPALYAQAACVVLPSRIEGFGIVALEAQRAGAPLCIARAGALPEVAAPGTPSFAPDDAVDCARAIRAALSLAPSSLEAARAHAARSSWDASARAWCEGWITAAGISDAERPQGRP
jgi:glycosyltransferase involved in cell wall biosynthesis